MSSPASSAEQTSALVDGNTPDVLAVAEASGISTPDVLWWPTIAGVDGRVPQDRMLAGQEAQLLSDWHLEIKGLCSATYKALQESRPGATRGALNADLELLTLNAVRVGVRKAMKNKYSEAQRTH